MFNEAIDQLNVNDERIAKRAEEAEERAKTYTDAHASDQSIHITDKEREKWSAGQLYKITENNGKVFYRGSSETTDFNTLTETGMYLIYNEGINSPPSSNRIFLLVMSFGNTLVQAAYESYKGTQSYFRFRKSDSTTWTPWQTHETTSGAQAKVDAHERNTNLHVNEGEREKWNNAQLYKITDSNGTRTKLPDGTDLLTLPTGFYYAMGHVVQNNPAENDSSWFNYDVIETGAGRKTIHAWRSYDNTLWHGTVHTDGVFKEWKRIITDADFTVMKWYDMTLVNGNKPGARKPQYAIWGNQVFTRGELVSPDFASVFTVLPKEARPSTQKSMAATLFGTTGTSKYIAETTGELRISGKHANIEANISGISLDNSFTL
nr:pyocin knob domain-containing protein [Bacillus haynesii]